jgi:ABC-type Fe3+-hydroxamate transport system substrate-binding protein
VTGGSVVSLVPSITETLLAWEVRPVAVTRFCPGRGITQVGGTKNPDIQAIIDLGPDVVLMDEEENRSEDAHALIGSGVAVHATRVRSVDDVAGALDGIRAVLGLPPVDYRVPKPHPVESRRVFVPIWKRPWMTIGGATYGSSLLASAGLANIYAGSDDPYPTVDLDEVAGRRPELVLAPSEPYPFAERHRSDLERVAPVVFVDGQDLFWWGQRTAAAVERISRLAAELSGA